MQDKPTQGHLSDGGTDTRGHTPIEIDDDHPLAALFESPEYKAVERENALWRLRGAFIDALAADRLPVDDVDPIFDAAGALCAFIDGVVSS